MSVAVFGDPRLPQRFWDKVSPEPNSGCWLWTGGADSNGYGRFGIPKAYKTTLTHRYSYSALVKPADGQFVLHRCDNPACCNPNHLFLGDQTDNMRDMARKGRNALNNQPLRNSQKTHCLNGHPLTGPHVRIWRGHRICNTCHAERVRQSKRNASNG